MQMLRQFYTDEGGFIISAELVIIATVVVIGLIAGLRCVQAAVVGELKDVAQAVDSLNQSYCYTGMRGCWAWGCGRHSHTRGSCFADRQDQVYQDPCEIGFLATGPAPSVILQDAVDISPGTVIESDVIPGGVIDDGTIIESPGAFNSTIEMPVPSNVCPPTSEGFAPLPSGGDVLLAPRGVYESVPGPVVQPCPTCPDGATF